jgi:hypothetical protein
LYPHQTSLTPTLFFIEVPLLSQKRERSCIYVFGGIVFGGIVFGGIDFGGIDFVSFYDFLLEF